MKKYTAAACFLFCLFLLEAQTEQEKNTDVKPKSKVGYTTNINFVASWPGEALLGVTEIFTVPVLNFDNPVTKDNNIKFKLGGEITPVTTEAKFGITWTPAAFLELYTEGRVGSGWKISKTLLGFGINEDRGGISFMKPLNFKRAVFTFTAGGAFQFDFGAVFPHNWSHIIFRIDQYALYKAAAGIHPHTSWIYQADYGTNRNGWRYEASYIIGYKMPIPLDLIVLKIDTEKTFFSVPAGLDKSRWGEDRIVTTIGPVLSFVIKKDYNILLLAQWKLEPAFLNNSEEIFYQKKIVNPAKKIAPRLSRVGIVFSMNINHR